MELTGMQTVQLVLIHVLKIQMFLSSQLTVVHTHIILVQEYVLIHVQVLQLMDVQLMSLTV